MVTVTQAEHTLPHTINSDVMQVFLAESKNYADWGHNIEETEAVFCNTLNEKPVLATVMIEFFNLFNPCLPREFKNITAILIYIHAS